MLNFSVSARVKVDLPEKGNPHRRNRKFRVGVSDNPIN